MADTDQRGTTTFPHTYRAGPSDPVRLADEPGTWAEVRIDAPSAQVWDLVTDLDLPARFSEEFMGAEWTDGGPAVGARFVGRATATAVE